MIVRAPLVHFIVLGAALAGLRATVLGRHLDTLVVPAHVVARDLSDAWIDDEVLYREGVRLGLGWNPASFARLLQVGDFVDADEHGDTATTLTNLGRWGLATRDPVVRAQIVARMRLRLASASLRDEPNDADLEAVIAAAPDRFVRPGRVTFAHVFVRRDTGIDAAHAIARRLRDDALPVAKALRLGDPFQRGEWFRSRTRSDVSAIFGADVANATTTLPVQQWSDPVTSPYGWHVVWVDERTNDAIATLNEARKDARILWRRTRAAAAVAEHIAELRARYRIETSTASPATP